MKLTVKEIDVILNTFDIQIEGFKTLFRQQYEDDEEIYKEDVDYYKYLLKLRKKFEKCKVLINKGVKHGKR